MRSAPWHVKGINPEARETAREAARRSGMSVGQWLNAVILEQADADDDHDDDTHAYGMHASGTHSHETRSHEDALSCGLRGEDLATINARLDDIGRQIELLSNHRVERERGRTAQQVEHHAAQQAAQQAAHQAAQQAAHQAVNEQAAQRIADAILRLNGRLDQVLAEGRSASSALEQRVNSVDQALAKLSRDRLRATASQSNGGPANVSVEQTIAEIAARQRALDGEFAAPPPADLQRPMISVPQCRADTAIEGVRKDLAEIGRMLADAMPRRAIEALETEVRALGTRLDARRETGIDGSALAGLEQGLREVRDALHGLAPAESLVGFDRAIRMLSDKVDMVAAGRPDPAALQPLETAIASLRGVMGQVASGDALAELATEVRGLADRIERGTPPAGGAELFATLNRQIGSIADAIETVRAESGRGVTPHLDQLVQSLNDKIDRIQSVPLDAVSRGEHLALGGLEDRITRLVEKLDASENRLGHLEAIERGMAELLVQLDGLRTNPPAAAPRPESAPVPMESLSQDIAALRQAQSVGEQRTQDTLEAVHDTIQTVVDRLATIEINFRRDSRPEPAPATPASAPAAATPSPAAAPMRSNPAPALAAATTAYAPEPAPVAELPPAPAPAVASAPPPASPPASRPAAARRPGRRRDRRARRALPSIQACRPIIRSSPGPARRACGCPPPASGRMPQAPRTGSRPPRRRCAPPRAPRPSPSRNPAICRPPAAPRNMPPRARKRRRPPRMRPTPIRGPAAASCRNASRRCSSASASWCCSLPRSTSR